MKQRVDYKLGYMLSRKQMDSLIQISRAGWSGKTSLEELTFKLRTEHRDERAWRRASREGQRSGRGACTCCRPEPGAGGRGEGGSPQAQGRGGPCSPCGALCSEVRYCLLSDIASFTSLPASLLPKEGRGRDAGRAETGAPGLLHRKAACVGR